MTQPETFHACPPDGSGLTPCCGRTPFELPRGDRINSETVTCTGHVHADLHARRAHPDWEYATTDNQEEYEAALRRELTRYARTDLDPGTGSDVGDQVAIVMGVRDRELEQLRAERRQLEDRVRAECDRLRAAAVLADGEPHTDRERGIVAAVTRVLAALDPQEQP